MGQGSESLDQSVGEYEWDELNRGLAFGIWTMRDGTEIKIKNMTLRHLEGARRVAERAAEHARDTAETELWNDWAEALEEEISHRPSQPQKPFSMPKPQRGSKTEMVCHCGMHYEARTADIARGWGLSCGKRCAAIRRDYGRPAAKPARMGADGKQICRKPSP